MREWEKYLSEKELEYNEEKRESDVNVKEEKGWNKKMD
jgi:hypothetical protein